MLAWPQGGERSTPPQRHRDQKLIGEVVRDRDGVPGKRTYRLAEAFGHAAGRNPSLTELRKHAISVFVAQSCKEHVAWAGLATGPNVTVAFRHVERSPGGFELAFGDAA